MRADFKRQLMAYLSTGGHRHAEMSKTLACNHCGERFKKGEALYNWARRERPELFTYKKPDFEPSPELKNMFQMLVDRVKNDKLYGKHLELSLKGTPEEQELETRRANSGYYTRHASNDKIIT